MQLEIIITTYLAMTTLYEFCCEPEYDLAWEEFYSYVQASKPVRDMIRDAICIAVHNFKLEDFEFIEAERFVFDHRDLVNDDDEIIYVPKLFSDEETRELLHWFLFRAQLAQYFQIRRNKGASYTFPAYFEDVNRNLSLWYSLASAFTNGFKKLDFRSTWRRMDMDSYFS